MGWSWELIEVSERKNVKSMRELRALQDPEIWKNGGFLTFLPQNSRYASAGILVRSHNYSMEITSCTYSLLVLQISQHFLNYKNVLRSSFLSRPEKRSLSEAHYWHGPVNRMWLSKQTAEYLSSRAQLRVGKEPVFIFWVCQSISFFAGAGF